MQSGVYPERGTLNYRPGLRVHWFRYSALVTRWSEEVDTEREEMFHTIKAYQRDMELWGKRAEERKALGKLGSAAYARRCVPLVTYSFHSSIAFQTICSIPSAAPARY